MSGTIDRNMPVGVTLVAGQWDIVLQVLGNGPYNAVRPIIDQIQMQCMRHAQMPDVAQSMAAHPGNGEDLMPYRRK